MVGGWGEGTYAVGAAPANVRLDVLHGPGGVCVQPQTPADEAAVVERPPAHPAQEDRVPLVHIANCARILRLALGKQEY